MAKARRRERPWRLVSREFTGDFAVRSMGPNSRGYQPFDIYGTYLCVYRQRYGTNGRYNERRETERSANLSEVLRCLSMTDKTYNLLALMQGGLCCLEKLFERYEWQMRQKAEKELEKRRAAWAIKKKGWDERKAHDKRIQRVRSKQFTRQVEA